MTLDDLAEWIGGRAQGRIIHFGACSVMRLGKVRLEDFRTMTGARAITGYRKDILWDESPAFELLMLSALCRFQKLGNAENYLRRTFGGLCDRLGLEIIR